MVLCERRKRKTLDESLEEFGTTQMGDDSTDESRTGHERKH